MYAKFEIKVLNNSGLNLGIQNDVSSLNFLLKCNGWSFSYISDKKAGKYSHKSSGLLS